MQYYVSNTLVLTLDLKNNYTGKLLPAERMPREEPISLESRSGFVSSNIIWILVVSC